MTKFSMHYFVKTSGMVLLLCLRVQSLFAENREIDSLKSLLPGAPELEKIKINYLIGAEFFNTLPDSSLHYFNVGLQLSQAANNDTFTAKCLNKIGILKFNSGEYEVAIRNFFSALSVFERYQDKFRTMRCLQYLGMAFNQQGMYDKALDYAKQSLEMCKATGDSASMAVSMTNIGSVYYSQSDFDMALDYFQQALHTAELIKDQEGIASGLNNVALIYQEKNNPGKALEFLLRSLALAKEMDDNRGIAASYHNIGRLYKDLKNYPVSILYLDSSIALAKKVDDKPYLKDAYVTLSELYSDMGNFEKAYQTHLLFSNLNDTLMNEENKKQLVEMTTRYETVKKDNQISVLNKDREKQKIIRNGFMGGFTVVLLFAGIFFTQRNKTKREKKRSDDLLLNILPSEVADEIKNTGTAKAKAFTMVTVMFTDFKDFTTVSEKVSAELLVAEIHTCFSAFDNILQKYKIEKIKTIGDAYLCASGLPVSNYTHAVDMLNAAFEIRDYIMLRKKEKETRGEIPFELRIGIHTGPVVAGIVGVKKYAYDIWGDTVNLAARMEQNSEAGKINISGSTFELVHDKFHCTHRGKIHAKNKGEIDMYFVDTAS